MECVLTRLQRWYHANCNDVWEHSYGVEIKTLDNPGWTIRISLLDTSLESRSFARVEVGEDDSNYDDEGNQIGPWWICWVENGVWNAACGPQSLENALCVFLDWADGQ